jgi:hypothetical protein
MERRAASHTEEEEMNQRRKLETRRHESHQQAVRAVSSPRAQRRPIGEGQPHLSVHDSREAFAEQQVQGFGEKGQIKHVKDREEIGRGFQADC